MLTDQIENNLLIWKKLGNNISITSFTSSAGTAECSGSRVYAKKFEALKKDPQKNITIFLLHDIGQYHGRFLSFINWTRSRNPGVSFIAMDFVGHGLSSGTRGHFEKFEHLVGDFLNLINQTEKKNDEFEKWILAGTGLGGLVALDLLNRHQDTVDQKIDGLILSNFLLKFSPSISLFGQFENQLNFSNMGLKKMIAHSRPLSILRSEEMLSSASDIMNFEQDPLVIQKPTLNSLREIQKKIANIYQDSYFLGKRLMLLKSEQDSAINANGIDYFAKGIKKELLTEKSYSLMRHDLYNENDKENVFQDITNWIKTYEN